jgi:hypothetical protein
MPKQEQSGVAVLARFQLDLVPTKSLEDAQPYFRHSSAEYSGLKEEVDEWSRSDS